MLTAHHIAGYSWEEADKFRKAMGKKIPEEMAKQKIKFIQGCVKQRHGSDQGRGMFGLGLSRSRLTVLARRTRRLTPWSPTRPPI